MQRKKPLIAKEHGPALLALIKSKVTPDEFNLINEQIKKLDSLTDVVSIAHLSEQIKRLHPGSVFSFLTFLNDDTALFQRELFNLAKYNLSNDEFHALFDMKHTTIIKLFTTREALISNKSYQKDLLTPLQILYDMIHIICEKKITEDLLLQILDEDDQATLRNMLSSAEDLTYCVTPNFPRAASAQQNPSHYRSSSPALHKAPSWRNTSTDCLQSLNSSLKYGRTISSTE